jgi:arylsulfatase A-like enzyme
MRALRGFVSMVVTRFLYLALGVLLLGGCAGDGPQTVEPVVPDHLVLITVDTLRGDHVLVDRAGQPLTPSLAALAGRGETYTAASSPSTMTSPGVASVLSGLLPRRCGVVSNDHVLAPEVPTLAKMLREAGFATAGIVANPVLRAGWGFDIGFDHYELLERQRPLRKARRPRARQVTDAAIAWLEQRPVDRRFFLWVHYMDPHGPYQPPEDLLALFPEEAFGDEREVPLLDDAIGLGGIPYYQQFGLEDPPTDPRYYLARYAGAVRSMDRGVGRLVQWLEDAGVLGTTVVAFTADHGEALEDDHGYYFGHMHGLTEDQVHVPLILLYPGVEPGRTVDRPVSIVDVVPTVLGLLAVSPPGDADGQRLAAAGAVPVVGQTVDERSVRDGSWKLIVGVDGSRRLYDLATDPGESQNVHEDHPEVARRLDEQLTAAGGRTPLAEPTRRGEVSEAEREALAALGYVEE